MSFGRSGTTRGIFSAQKIGTSHPTAVGGGLHFFFGGGAGVSEEGLTSSSAETIGSSGDNFTCMLVFRGPALFGRSLW